MRLTESVEAFTILLHVYLYILSCPPLPKQNDFIMFSFTVDNTKENKCNFNLYILKLYYLCIEELNNCKNNLMTLNRFFIFFCFFLLSNFSLYFLFLVFSFENQYIYIYMSFSFDVPFVCMSWYKASLNPMYWKHLVFPDINPSDMGRQISQ